MQIKKPYSLPISILINVLVNKGGENIKEATFWEGRESGENIWEWYNVFTGENVFIAKDKKEYIFMHKNKQIYKTKNILKSAISLAPSKDIKEKILKLCEDTEEMQQILKEENLRKEIKRLP